LCKVCARLPGFFIGEGESAGVFLSLVFSDSPEQAIEPTVANIEAGNFAIAGIPHCDKLPRMIVFRFNAFHGITLAQTLAQTQVFVGCAIVSD
jgi:hypothetical protein